MIKSKPVGPAYEKAVCAAMSAYKTTGDVVAYEWALSVAQRAQDDAIARGGFPVGYHCSAGPHTNERTHLRPFSGEVDCAGHAVPDEVLP